MPLTSVTGCGEAQNDRQILRRLHTAEHDLMVAVTILPQSVLVFSCSPVFSAPG